MQWESLGFKGDPLTTDPITQSTLELYTGHSGNMAKCQNVLSQKNILLVVEGARGVGTTSFSNYLRFSVQEKGFYFTPRNEIRVESDWRLETLLAVVISNIVRELEIFHPEKVMKDKRFQETRALSLRISEAYRSFGIEAFGFGLNYGKSAESTQPTVVPTSVLGHHLEDLSALIQSLGYRYGTVVQLNNLDIGVVQDEKHMKYLFNALRDYIQTDGISWILVGDVGLRRFIAQEVDRLDDIVSYEVEINPLTKMEYRELLMKRIAFYRSNPHAEMPVDNEVFNYLYEIAKGRLRYVFGLLQRLINDLSIGDLSDRITLNIAKPMIIKLAMDRIARNKLSSSEEHVLKLLVMHGKTTSSALAEKMNKSRPFISKILARLISVKLITFQREAKNKYYSPLLDATIAYAEEEQTLLLTEAL
jgi:DNA-binding transcriptional ArsR family regulator